MRFNVPAPPSANRLWVFRRGSRPYKSKEYKSWLEEAAWSIRHQHKSFKTSAAQLTISVVPHPANGHHERRDLDNYMKPIGDLLEYAGIIADDHQIFRIVMVRGQKMQRHHCEIILDFQAPPDPG